MTLDRDPQSVVPLQHQSKPPQPTLWTQSAGSLRTSQTFQALRRLRESASRRKRRLFCSSFKLARTRRTRAVRAPACVFSLVRVFGQTSPAFALFPREGQNPAGLRASFIVSPRPIPFHLKRPSIGHHVPGKKPSPLGRLCVERRGLERDFTKREAAEITRGES